jgi:ATP-binding cassette subfamily F protein uup
LVSHDRAFLNNLVTSTLILSGDGTVKEYVGGYDDWQKQIEQSAASKTPKPASAPQADSKADAKPTKRKLSYNDKRELEELPKRIEMLEAEQSQLTAQMEAPAFYQQEGEKITQAVNRLEEIQKELSQAYQRWGELDS